MLDPTRASAPTTRLRAMLRAFQPGLDEEVLAEARAVGPEHAADAVVFLLEAGLTRREEEGPAIRAAHLAHELKLARAVPALASSLQRLPNAHPLRDTVITALSRLGADGVAALLAAFDRCTTPEERAELAEAFARTALDDERVRGALVRMLDDDPVNGARLLARRGEWRALPDLYRAFDRVVRAPAADCEICASEHLVSLTAAIGLLGGTLSEAQCARVEAALDRADAAWTPVDHPGSSHLPGSTPAKRAHRAGRNDPCPCGSGKKYKRCHLEADERGITH